MDSRFGGVALLRAVRSIRGSIFSNTKKGRSGQQLQEQVIGRLYDVAAEDKDLFSRNENTQMLDRCIMESTTPDLTVKADSCTYLNASQ